MVGRSREVRPYFLRSEDNDTLSGEWHGVGGPLGVSSLAPPHRLTRAFVQACQQYRHALQSGFQRTAAGGSGALSDDDPRCAPMFRGHRLSSAGARRAQPYRDRRARWSAASSFEKDRAVGVEIIENGRPKLLRAEREILLASGAIGSPKLMLLSGLGPADELRASGCPWSRIFPASGRNLHDHFGIDIVYELSWSLQPRQIHQAALDGLGWARIPRFRQGTRDLQRGRGRRVLVR